MFSSPFLATARSSLTHALNLEEIIIALIIGQEYLLIYGEITKFPLNLESVKGLNSRTFASVMIAQSCHAIGIWQKKASRTQSALSLCTPRARCTVLVRSWLVGLDPIDHPFAAGKWFWAGTLGGSG